MATFISHNAAETEALGEALAQEVEAGWVIGLSGDLGAGKTQFVKGLARGLGSPARVHSPTFALLNIYLGGRLTLFHLDLYRLDTREQIRAAGLEEYLRPSGVAVIEWAEKLSSEAETSPSKPPGHPPPESSDVTQPVSALFTRLVKFDVLGETERRISYEDPGA